MMLRLKKIFLGVFTVCSTLGFAQDKKEELLDWSASRRLTWNDFKAKPEPGSDVVAITTSILSIEYKISGSGFDYKIKSRFSKTNSWGLRKTDYILSHEQGHFDIAEIFARKLHQRLSEYRFNKRTIDRDLDKIYNRILEEKEKMQNDYDRETKHSINKEKQAVWLKKISKMLVEYKGYAGY